MKRIFIPISTLFVVGLSHAQATNTENYVHSRTYLEPVTTSSSTVRQIETVQYFDGLGRPKQIVNVKASPLSKDVVTHIEYDGFGRQVKDFLPVPQSGTGNGAIVPSPLSNATSTPYGSEKIYAEKTVENSPLERILSQKQVGDAWNNKPVTFDYDANADGEVKKYVATFDYGTFTSSIVLSTAGYGANQLYKNSVTDEDGNKTIEFKNSQGQVILVRKMLDATTEADTYYVYNDYDQLAYVIPPLAVAANNVDTVTTLENLCYQYKYDGRNRLVEKKLPGKGWEYMVYDKQDRLVLTQDVNLRAQNRWLYTKYDQFGRVLHTGISDGSTRSQEQSNTDAKGANNEYRLPSNSYWMNSGMEIHYSNGSGYPNATIFKVLSLNFYDTYPTNSPPAPSPVFGQVLLTDDAQNNNFSTKSLPVASYIKNIEDDNWTRNYTWYNTKGRSIATHSINHLGGYTKTETRLDFSGTVQESITRHKRLATDTERMITENFTYDHQNRLLTHTHKVDNLATEYLAQNEYNELSQLTGKKVGGISSATPLQEVNYAYNIRGWMTKINDPQNLGTKLFGYELRYNNPVNTASSTGKFNGNIAESTWKTASDQWPRRYNYQYDGLNRLLTGKYSEPEGQVIQNNYYNETLTYDLNGNIMSLVRNTKDVAGATPMDNLAYAYTGNKLNTVTDSSQNYSGYPDTSGTLIDYDLNGNMTSHSDKGIMQIDYNHLNLPKYVQFNDYVERRGKQYVNTNYKYRSDGTKVSKTYQYRDLIIANTLTTKITEYLDGFQYEAAIGGSGNFPATLNFVPTAEGYYNFENNKYIYNYTDHLGNVRLSYFNGGNGVEVLEENNYYPFGLKHEGYNATAGNASYQYKYNGKELQVESGMYDYGARFYMPDIGRWGVVDPLAEKMTHHSPYNYAFNNPLRFIDPDGREPEHINPSAIFEKNKDGSYKNPKLVQAWNQFATSKDGQNFLKDYASPGQVVAGHKYSDAGGKYDKAGIDLSFDNGKALNDRNSSNSVIPAMGITYHKEENGRVNFRVSITDSGFVDTTLETVTHELGIHVKLGAADYFDNKKFDFSTGYESIAKDGYTQSYLNENFGPRTGRGATHPDHLVNTKTNQAYKLGLPIIKALYQKYNINRTDAQIKNLYNH